MNITKFHINYKNVTGFIKSYRFRILSSLRTAYCLLITVYCLLPNNAIAKGSLSPDNSFYIVHDYQENWQVFDERYKAYVPYVREQHKDYNSFSLFFDIENYKGYKILYRSEKENYLFIDASLQKQLPISTLLVLDIDSLQNVFGKTK